MSVVGELSRSLLGIGAWFGAYPEVSLSHFTSEYQESGSESYTSFLQLGSFADNKESPESLVMSSSPVVA
jgi:hypothetical protein